LKRFCRLEVLARTLDVHMTADGIFDKEGDVKRMVSEYRAITATQQRLAEALGLTPETRMRLIKERRGGGIDLMAEYSREDDKTRGDN
jgi:plasmid maintenance system antidote protein VapI